MALRHTRSSAVALMPGFDSPGSLKTAYLWITLCMFLFGILLGNSSIFVVFLLVEDDGFSQICISGSVELFQFSAVAFMQRMKT